ncbi:MAG: hypothetical protein SCARUB_04457 [Candidatus Scalindua rubra]|uniref:Uncharacterized protein n=1 Tax=Candidatus Scalindua rubra TaxID=1872076 RepID=A0A1E3X4A0_9BACT|nr:MAG: hypothetical protein SCARUB_04457 [Candidatus Scalindua rubra]
MNVEYRNLKSSRAKLSHAKRDIGKLSLSALQD